MVVVVVVVRGGGYLEQEDTDVGEGRAGGAGAAGVGDEVAEGATRHELHDDAEVLACVCVCTGGGRGVRVRACVRASA